MINKVRDLQEVLVDWERDIQELKDTVLSDEDGVFSIINGKVSIMGHIIDPIKEPPRQYSVIWFPNITTRGPGTKSTRFSVALEESGILDSKLVFDSEAKALEAAKAIYELFSQV